MENKSVFDLLTLPDGIDRNTCIDNIILECGEFETLYSDPFFMRAAIGTWGAKHYRTFEKWIAALNLEYNPLENYDRLEDWDDTINNSGTENRTDTLARTTGDNLTRNTGDNLTRNTSDSLSRSTTDSGTAENKVSAFDSSTYQPSTEDTHSNTGSQTDTMAGTQTDVVTGTQTDVASGTQNDNATGNTTTSFGEAANHKGRIHGNVGVTTSQQMLQSEIDISRFNIIQEITNLFMVELCIMVYE